MTRINSTIAPPQPQPYVRMRRPVAEYYKLYELGVYGSTEIFGLGSVVTSDRLPNISLPVDDLFS